MRGREKVVELVDTVLVVHGCTDTLDLEERIEHGYALIRSREPETIRLNGSYVELDQLPDTIRDSRLEILSDDAEAIILYSDKICKAFTDGEYAYMPCITEQDMEKLLQHILSKTWEIIHTATRMGVTN